MSTQKAKHEAALEEIRGAREKIFEEINRNKAEIDRLQNENAELPKLIAPFEEIKKGVLSLVDAAGERWAKDKIRSAIINFATGAYCDPGLQHEYGKPLRLNELDGAINGTMWPAARMQFLSPSTNSMDDMIFYAVFPEAVKVALSKVMETITPEEFGMGHLSQTRIGPTLSEMHERISKNNEEIERLKNRNSALNQELRALSI